MDASFVKFIRRNPFCLSFSIFLFMHATYSRSMVADTMLCLSG